MKFIIYPKHPIFRPLTLIAYLLLSVFIYYQLKPSLISYFSHLYQDPEKLNWILPLGMGFSIAVIWWFVGMIFLLDYFHPMLKRNSNHPVPAVVLFPFALSIFPLALAGETLFKHDSVVDFVISSKIYIGVVIAGIVAVGIYLPLIARGAGKQKS